MKKTLITVAVAILAVGSVQAEWTEVTKSKKSDTYADGATIKDSGKYRVMWMLDDFRGVKQKAGHRTFKSVKIKSLFDCKGERMADLSVIAYSGAMGDGDVVESTNVDEILAKWVYIAPDTSGAKWLAIACGND